MFSSSERGNIVRVLRGYTSREAPFDNRAADPHVPVHKQFWIQSKMRGRPGHERLESKLVIHYMDPLDPSVIMHISSRRYAEITFLVQYANGEIDNYEVGHLHPWAWMRIVTRGLWDLLTAAERHTIAGAVDANRRISTSWWAEWHDDLDFTAAAGTPERAVIRHHGCNFHHVYAEMRDYVRSAGPDLRVPEWWKSCWHSGCVSDSCDGVHHVNASGQEWERARGIRAS